VGESRRTPLSDSSSAAGVTAEPSIPDYQLLRVIGQGSYGDVWLARGITGVFRAVKVVWRSRFPEAGPFEREFKGLTEFAAVPLGDAHQLAIAHVGKNDEAGFFYYVMEVADDVVGGRTIDPTHYVPLTLSSMRSLRRRLPAIECVTIAVDLARALADLHARGLIHRDIKPSNVIFISGAPKLADIGLIAKATGARTYVGTEGYIPPEGPGTASADVYGLGKLLYEISTGMDRNDYPRLPPAFGELPDRAALLELNEIVIRACAESPQKRYADANQLLADLEVLANGKSIRKLNARKRGLSFLLKVGAAAAVVVGVTFAWNARQAEPSEGAPPISKTAEADQLLLRVKSLTDGIYTRNAINAADELARRATDLAPLSARAWGYRAYCSACQLLRNWDVSPARREDVQESANHALAIDRDEPMALLASAILLRRQGAHAQSEVVIRHAIIVRPEDPRLWRMLSISTFDQGKRDEAIVLAEDAKRKFPQDPLVHYDLALLYGQREDFERFEQNVDSALALKIFQPALITKVDVVIFRRGDLATARATLARIDPEERAEDRVVACALNLGVLERSPARVHEAALLTASSYIADFVTRGGPKAFWRALAYQQEKKSALERENWQEAEVILRKRRQERTGVVSDQARLATALVWLGRTEEAAQEISSYEATYTEQPTTEKAVLLAVYYSSLGDAKKAVPFLRYALNKWSGVSYHLLRLHPWWDKIRGQPEFEDLLVSAKPKTAP
jgi:serine/threonine protein kinase